MTGYYEQLKDPRWQKKRLERLSLARWECENCGSGTETLNVHHVRYLKGRKPWEYSDDELQVLCQSCHKEHHAAEDAVKQVFASNSIFSPSLMGLCAGYLDAGCDLGEDLQPLFDSGCGEHYLAGVIARMLLDGNRSARAVVAEAIYADRGETLTPAERTAMELYLGRELPK